MLDPQAEAGGSTADLAAVNAKGHSLTASRPRVSRARRSELESFHHVPVGGAGCR